MLSAPPRARSGRTPASSLFAPNHNDRVFLVSFLHKCSMRYSIRNRRQPAARFDRIVRPRSTRAFDWPVCRRAFKMLAVALRNAAIQNSVTMARWYYRGLVMAIASQQSRNFSVRSLLKLKAMPSAPRTGCPTISSWCHGDAMSSKRGAGKALLEGGDAGVCLCQIWQRREVLYDGAGPTKRISTKSWTAPADVALRHVASSLCYTASTRHTPSRQKLQPVARCSEPAISSAKVWSVGNDWQQLIARCGLMCGWGLAVTGRRVTCGTRLLIAPLLLHKVHVVSWRKRQPISVSITFPFISPIC